VNAIASSQSPLSSRKIAGLWLVTGDSKWSQTAAVGQGPHMAEEAGDRAPGRG